MGVMPAATDRRRAICGQPTDNTNQMNVQGEEMINMYSTPMDTDMEEGWPLFKTYEQLCILVLDGSGSMAALESSSGLIKADSVEEACRELLDRLQSSDMADQFLLAAVTFDDRVDCPLLPTAVDEMDEGDLVLDLLQSHGSVTAVGDALARAGQIAEQFLQGEDAAIPRYVVILLMSDGQSNHGSDPLQVANQLKARFDQIKAHGPEMTLAAAAYGDDAAEDTLRQIASGSDYYKRVKTGSELRDFFFSSVSRSLAGQEIAVAA
jgi:hypothetical protein